MMRIWLIVPPRPRDQILNLIPPYNLGYLATAARQAEWEPRIVDCAVEGWEHADLVARIEKERPEVVGFTVFTSDYASVKKALHLIKQLPQPPVTLVGGIHPSSYPEPTLESLPEADYIFVGEAEPGLQAWLKQYATSQSSEEAALAKIPGLGWRQQGKTQINPRVQNMALEGLGLPAWDLMDPMRYQQHPPTLFVRQRPFAPIITTRGCPFHCTFCAGYNVTGYRVRNRPWDEVFEEIDFLRQKYNIRELHIEDDNFTWHRPRAVEFCEELIRRNWKLSWTMPNGVRLDTLDLELLKLMKRAGCYLLILGVESGSDRILEHMRKKITVKQVEEKVNLVQKAGILPHAFFMLGYPEETPADIQATMDLSLRLPLIGAHFSSYRPLPGTESARQLIERNEIKDFEFASEKGTFASVIYAPRGMQPEQIKNWQKKMLRAFYFRWRILWLYGLETLRHPGLFFGLLRRAFLYLFRT
jgi:radical SAM superfamily enzyme YgiQ (UPF0313 family)